MTFTLTCDGPFDRVLIPIIRWTLARAGQSVSIAYWADFRSLPRPPRTVAERVRRTLELYPFSDAIFVHMDSKRDPFDVRLHEIQLALREVRPRTLTIPIVPVRMTEAWLLGDEAAIRSAAGNPNGREALDLPPIRDLESLPSPKEVLHRLLGDASGLNSRRRAALNPGLLASRIPDHLASFEHLDALPAFRAFQEAVLTEFGP